jgi:hypothetical protein
MVDSSRDTIQDDYRVRAANEVVKSSGPGGQGNKREQPRTGRVDQRRGSNDIAGKLCANGLARVVGIRSRGEWIIDLNELPVRSKGLRKVPGALRRRGNGPNASSRGRAPKAVVTGKEEGAIASEGTSCSCTELVFTERRLVEPCAITKKNYSRSGRCFAESRWLSREACSSRSW